MGNKPSKALDNEQNTQQEEQFQRNLQKQQRKRVDLENELYEFLNNPAHIKKNSQNQVVELVQRIAEAHEEKWYEEVKEVKKHLLQKHVQKFTELLESISTSDPVSTSKKNKHIERHSTNIIWK